MSEVTPLNYEELAIPDGCGRTVRPGRNPESRPVVIRFLLALSAELMLDGVSLSLVTFGKIHQNQEGQAFTIFSGADRGCL
ncbi:MAG UNVERIFIED_CONTAM: hypothetical protein LVR18_51080 [Planctomycetaceae bacterium]|jgi:hypothetical protein